MTVALHSRLFQAIAAVVLAAIILGLGYLGSRGELPSGNLPPEKLRIALPVVPDAALVHVAAAKRYFAEEGLDVTILPVNYGVAAIDYVRQGKADLAVAAEVPFVISVMNGDALGIVASLVSVSNNNAIIARRDHSIAAPRDLAGKKMGSALAPAVRTSCGYFSSDTNFRPIRSCSWTCRRTGSQARSQTAASTRWQPGSRSRSTRRPCWGRTPCPSPRPTRTGPALRYSAAANT